jgi:hypothetical protein
MKPLASLLPELKLDDKAASVLTPTWIKKTKAECLKLKSSGKIVKLGKGVVGDYLGTVDGHKVYAVDSDTVNEVYWKITKGDFTEAGNHQKWSFIPDDEFWVDSIFVPTPKLAHYLLHEAGESRAMKLLKWAYDKAHKLVGNILEWSWVKEGETNGESSQPEKAGSPKGPAGSAAARRRLTPA